VATASEISVGDTIFSSVDAIWDSDALGSKKYLCESSLGRSEAVHSWRLLPGAVLHVAWGETSRGYRVSDVVLEMNSEEVLHKDVVFTLTVTPAPAEVGSTGPSCIKTTLTLGKDATGPDTEAVCFADVTLSQQSGQFKAANHGLG
jgi:hypothetical protein